MAGAVVEDTVEKKKKKHKRTKGEDAADEGSREVVQPGSQKDKAESQEGSADVKDDNMEHGARHSPVQITLKKKKKSSDKETRKKPKKSHKKDNSASSFPDPHNDATLSDKGRAGECLDSIVACIYRPLFRYQPCHTHTHVSPPQTHGNSTRLIKIG